MKDTLDEPGRLSCTDAALLLEKQIAEEPLLGEQQTQLAAHIQQCDACRRLMKWTAAFREHAPSLSNEDIRTAYQSALKNKNRPASSAGPWKIAAVAGFAAAAAFAAVIAADGWFQSLPSTDREIAPDEIACSPSPPTEPVTGVLMTYCGPKMPDAVIDDDGSVRVSLQRGMVGMRVDPNRPDKHDVTVETPHGRVRVKGTVFTVRVDRDEANVEVFRGVVEFLPATPDETPLQVPAGRGADLRRCALFDLPSPKAEALRRTLDAAAADRYPARQALPNPSDQVTAPSRAIGNPESVEVVHESTDPLSKERSMGQLEAHLRAGSSAPPRRSPPTIDVLIQDAQSCLIEQDWTCAASRYRDILRLYPTRREATAALVSLAKIELRRLHSPDKALEHYQTYRQRAPTGPMSEEALFGIAEAYRRLGQRDFEQETLRTFIERYPGSSQQARARARLRQLEAVPK